MTREDLEKIAKDGIALSSGRITESGICGKEIGRRWKMKNSVCQMTVQVLKNTWKSLTFRGNAYKMKKVLKKPVMMCLEV